MPTVSPRSRRSDFRTSTAEKLWRHWTANIHETALTSMIFSKTKDWMTGFARHSLCISPAIRIPITLDIGFDDAMTEPNHTIEYASILGLPTGKVCA